MISVPVFAPDFDRQPSADAREAYVARELRRVQAQGPLSVTAILAGAPDGAAAVAFGLIERGRDKEGTEVAPPGFSVQLRVVEGASLPHSDPQGRKLSPDRAGKVLVVKTGQRAMGGAERSTADKARRDIYHTVEVTPTARPFRLREAIIILRQWGVGLADETVRHVVEEVLPEPRKAAKGGAA